MIVAINSAVNVFAFDSTARFVVTFAVTARFVVTFDFILTATTRFVVRGYCIICVVFHFVVASIRL